VQGGSRRLTRIGPTVEGYGNDGTETVSVSKRGGRYKRAYRTVAGLSLAAFLGAVGSYQYYAMKLPRRADPASGRIHALANHGVYVYLTRTEQVVLLSLFGAAIIGILVAVALRVASEGLHYERPGPE
jgi:hypothetical protein